MSSRTSVPPRSSYPGQFEAWQATGQVGSACSLSRCFALFYAMMFPCDFFRRLYFVDVPWHFFAYTSNEPCLGAHHVGADKSHDLISIALYITTPSFPQVEVRFCAAAWCE